MRNKLFVRLSSLILLWVFTSTSYANSVGFDISFADLSSSQLEITVVYDFSTFAMFGGGLDLYYDSTRLELVSYQRAPLAPDAQPMASPIGELVAPGLYSGFGIGTFEFFNGMTSVSEIGTFVFNFLGPGVQDTPCGGLLCLTGNITNPFVSLAGVDVTDELLANGITVINLTLPFPIPASIWFMLSGLGILWKLGRR